MSKHNDDTCPHLVRASLLEAENARLKADVNELADGLRLASEVGIKIADEVTRLKAEVEAQAKRWAESEDLILHYKQQRDEAYNDCECHRLKAEVERLTEIIRREVDGGVDLREEAQRTVEENHKLRAEVERLRNLGIKLDGYVDLVRHENERLRKAGDAMAGALSPFRVKPFPGPYLCDLQKGWNAAKEGKSV